MIKGKKISELVEQTKLTGNEFIPIQVGVQNMKIKSDLLKGQKGPQGEPGNPGKDGKDGITPDISNLATKDELKEKADKVKRVNNDVTTLEIKPNTLYVWDEVTSLNITLAVPTDNTIKNEYMFQFTSGTQPTTLSLPQDIKWIGDNKIEASKTYQVSIVNNIAIMGGV